MTTLMSKHIALLQALVAKGAEVYVFDNTTAPPDKAVGTLHYVCGGVDPVKFNWIVYYPAFPDGPQDLHDALVTRFHEVGDAGTAARFVDQYGREVVFAAFDPDDAPQRRTHRAWRAALKEQAHRAQQLAQAIEQRRTDPSAYLGGTDAKRFTADAEA